MRTVTRLISALVMVVGAAGIAAGSYRLSAGHWPGVAAGVSTGLPAGASAGEAQRRQVFYWRDPDGKPTRGLWG